MPPAEPPPGPIATRRERARVLRAWLLAESAYAAGHLADEVLTFVQDGADRVLGGAGTVAVGEHLRATGSPEAASQALAAAAGDPARVDGLLDLAARAWRPGAGVPRPVEEGPFAWSAEPPDRER